MITVFVKSAGYVIDEQTFLSVPTAMKFADEQQDLGFKVRVVVASLVAA